MTIVPCVPNPVTKFSSPVTLRIFLAPPSSTCPITLPAVIIPKGFNNLVFHQAAVPKPPSTTSLKPKSFSAGFTLDSIVCIPTAPCKGSIPAAALVANLAVPVSVDPITLPGVV